MPAFVTVETPRRTRFAVNPETVSAVRANEDGRSCTLFLTGGRDNVEVAERLEDLLVKLSKAGA